MKFILLIALLFVLSTSMFAQTIPANRKTDWSIAGYEGTIPCNGTIRNVVTEFGADKTGTTNVTTIVNNALNSISNGDVLFFPNGIYLFNGTINVPSNRIIRGESPTTTILRFNFTGNGNCIAIQGSLDATKSSITAIGAAGTNTLTVSNISGFAVGDDIEIEQANDPLVHLGTDLSNTWAANLKGQMAKIAAISGSVVTLDRSLIYEYDINFAMSLKKINSVKEVGLESFKLIRVSNNGLDVSNNNIAIAYAKNIWLNRVHSEYSSRYHVRMEYSRNITISECFLDKAYNCAGGGAGYGLLAQDHVSECLFENNIAQSLRHPWIAKEGSARNVYAYNFSYGSTQGTTCSEDPLTNSLADISLHGYYASFNLFEGNIVYRITSSDDAGASGPGNTFFRNRVLGSKGIWVLDNSKYQNVIGNELTYTAKKPQFEMDRDGSIQGTTLNFANYYNLGVLDVAATTTQPNSLYLSAKPSFFGSNPWPSIGPGITFNTGTIPAQTRFESGNYFTIPAPCSTTPTCTATITSPSNSFCTGGSVVLTSSTGTSYKWFNGTTQVGTSATYTASAAGSYTVEVTNAAGCKATSAVKTITVDALPTATITSPSNSFCTAGSVVLTASAETAYKWFNGTTQVGTSATYTATAAGSYTVEVTNTAGCKATSTVKTITVDALPTATITSPSNSFCTGGSVVLTSSTGTSYKWFNGTTQVGTSATYTAIGAGSYTVEVTNAAGCKATSTVKTITVDALPTATITSPSNSFCTAGSVVLTASAGTAYKWFNGTTQVGTSATYTATAAGSYTVEVTNTAGCKATSTVKTITVDALPTATITSPSNSFCTGGSVILTSSTGTSYKWFNGTTQVGTSATYTATAAGSYTVEVTNTAGCKATSTVKTITVDALPTATITSTSNSFCTGGSVILTSSTGTSYKWFNGTTQVETSATYTATAAGSYTVEVTNTAGCKATSTVKTITVDALPTATITSPSNSFCTGGSVVLTSSTGTSYKWFNGTTQVGTSATYTAIGAGSYTVEVTNAAGCKNTSAVKTISVTASIIWYADTDNDGKGDPGITQNSCIQPVGYVSIAGDACPTDANKIAAGNCGCANTEQSCLDCAGVANGTAALDVCNICSGGTTGITPKTNISQCTTTAITSGLAANMKMYPNPTADNCRIELSGSAFKVTIYTVSGIQIFSNEYQNEAIIGNGLPQGIYLIRIEQDGNVELKKLIKQ